MRVDLEYFNHTSDATIAERPRSTSEGAACAEWVKFLSEDPQSTRCQRRSSDSERPPICLVSLDGSEGGLVHYRHARRSST
jgi:hypothetical protein